MSGNPAFLIMEKDGVEFDIGNEYIPESVDILFETGSIETIKDYLMFPNNALIPRVVATEITIKSGFIVIAHETCFEDNLILDGDMVVI